MFCFHVQMIFKRVGFGERGRRQRNAGLIKWEETPSNVLQYYSPNSPVTNNEILKAIGFLWVFGDGESDGTQRREGWGQTRRENNNLGMENRIWSVSCWLEESFYIPDNFGAGKCQRILSVSGNEIVCFPDISGTNTLISVIIQWEVI